MILLNKTEVKTMTSQERITGLHQALISVYENKVDGDFVECGVYKGGNVIIAKKFFDSVNETTKKFFAFDTFEGMTPPGGNDPENAHSTWQNKNACRAHLDEVMEEFKKHDILDNRVLFVVGDVCKTLREDKILEKISILRLDTDWYESTKIELEILYEKLTIGGYLIIDDYGHWSGCKKAVDEFFGLEFVNKNFTKLDYTGIMYKKK